MSRRTAMAPMLVMRGIRGDMVETKERLVVQAFVDGYATPEDYDHLADMQGLLILAGSTSAKRKPAADYARQKFGPILEAIKARYLESGALTCLPEEIREMRSFVGRYRDFWLRQPTELFIEAVQALQAHHNRIIAARKAEAECAA